jgi:GntR family transcriptional regulator
MSEELGRIRMPLEPPRARYQQVADDVRDAIKRGEFAPGTMLPSQPELARRYGLNQTSINRAIAVLRVEGYVRVEHGRGAFVQEVPTVKRVRRIDRDYRTRPAGSAYAEQIEQSGLRPRTKLADVSIVTPPAEIAEALKLTETDQAVMRHRLMYADDVVVQVATSYIPVDLAGGTDIAYPDTGPSGIYARLDQRGHGPVRFTEDIEVRRPTEDEALILRIPEGQPVLEILRTAYAADDRPVEACANVLAAYQWRLTYRWSQGTDVDPDPSTLPEPAPVVAAIVTSRLGVLVARRDDGKPPWTFIAGEIEPGEDPADAAVREVKEETGMRIRATGVIGRRIHPQTGREMVYLAARPTHGTKAFVGDEQELAEVRWVDLAQADELMGGAMFEPVHSYLEKMLKAQDSK